MEPIEKANKVDYSGPKKVINIITLVIIAVVAALKPLGGQVNLGDWTTTLPHIYSHTNLLTGILLILALIAIKAGKVGTHKFLMMFCTLLGFAFLVMYILYKMSNQEMHFQGTGSIRTVYFTILISHILLAVVVVRFVLLALFYAMMHDFERHKKVVKITFPVWLYVSFTGYIVYAMLQYS